MNNPNNNPDEAHGNNPGDNITGKTDKTKFKKDICQSLKDFSILDGKTILQVNATTIVGILFFLSLTSIFQGGLSLTFILIIPFVVSALTILLYKSERLARACTIAGFVYLAFVLFIYGISDYTPLLPIPQPQAEKCGKDPEAYGVTDLWKCSKFTGGSLAEKCAIFPFGFDKNLSDCSDFIPPSDVS